MTPGSIVMVDWRDALPGASEVRQRRPAIVVGNADVFGTGLPFALVVPLTAEAALAIEGVSLPIEPARTNGCSQRSYALAWNVQTVAHARITETASHIEPAQLEAIREQIAFVAGFPT